MPSGDWTRARPILEACFDLPEDEQHAFLDRACAGDAGLRAYAAEMLELDRSAGSFLETPVPAADADDPLAAGVELGSYALDAEIGAGGMGTVWSARRVDHEFEKRVAIKVLKRGMDSRELLDRFRLERQVLAKLEHQGIARMLDGGSTPDGRPYIVMEYVEGAAIDEYCRANDLGLRARIELFRKVCAAVQYAHQNLVVHRDIKPSNILVGADGEPKLLDFGIAKALDPRDARSGWTTVGQRPLTPRYASPEQLSGGEVGTATDVYSLGVVLYELLTERSPYVANDTASPELERVVRDADPLLPSAAVTTGADDTIHWDDVRRLKRALAGDLDNVVLMALRKDPRRRYASADLLSEDLRRYLAGRTVIARPDTVVYRASRFVRRHRAPLSAVGLLVVALGLALTVSSRFAASAERSSELAERRADDMRALALQMVFETDRRLRSEGLSVAARRSLLESAGTSLDALGEDVSDFERGAAYLQLAELQGDPFRSHVGAFEAAQRNAERALAAATHRLNDPDTERGPAHRLAARAQTLLGSLAEVGGDRSRALEHYASARTHVAQAEPNGVAAHDSQLRESWIAVAVRESFSLVRAGDGSAAVEVARRARASVPEEAPHDTSALRAQRARLDVLLGNTLFAVGFREEALPPLHAAESTLRGLLTGSPRDRALQRELATCVSALGRVFVDLERPDRARAPLDEAIALRRELILSDSENRLHLNDLAMDLRRLSDLEARNGNPTRGLEVLGEVVAIRERLLASGTHLTYDRRELAIAHDLVGAALARAGRFDEALEAQRAALEDFERLLAEDPTDTDARRSLVVCHYWIAQSCIGPLADEGLDAAARRACLEAAHEAWSRCLELLEELRRDDRLLPKDEQILVETEGNLATCERKLAELPG